MKKGVLAVTLLISVFTLNFVSAFFNSYGGFSLSNFFSSLDPATVTYGLLFFIFFTLLLLILTKMKLFSTHRKGQYGQKIEETNTMAASIISFAMATLIVYYLYRSGYSIESLFYGLGFSGNFTTWLLVILTVLMVFFAIKKFKFPGFLIVAGLFFIFASLFTNLIYEKGTAFVIGIALILIGILSWKAARKWFGSHVNAI